MLTVDELANILTQGIEECRQLISLAVQNNLPINEAPLFSWGINGKDKSGISTHTTREELCQFFLRLQSHIESGRKETPICGIIPLKKEGQVGYFIFLAETNGNVFGIYQRGPILSDDKTLMFSNPVEVNAISVIQDLISHNVYH